ncbi:hypothetical protein [Solibacillus cecembensis]|uniref:hypothetical protein n=1 Tax=Solibacillus cecembensis TaxID=459347 RepID=UPI000716EF7D
MKMKDFFAGLFFLFIAAYFAYELVQNMPQLFIEGTTMWQYFIAFFRVALIIFVFNLGLTLIKRFFVSRKAA